MTSKVIGGSLLIVGTSIGAGMLALPVATAAGGFYHSLWLFFGAWLITVLGAFFILEVTLWLPENTNLISMARATLGPWGQIITWLSYLCLLYSLLAAYTAGGSDLFHNLLQYVHIRTTRNLDAAFFVLLFGAIVYQGIRVVDWTNRALMFFKLLSYILLIALIFSHIHFSYLSDGHFHKLLGATMVVITSFGYATVIPSLRTYFKSDVNKLRLVIVLGSLISLFCYLLWDLVVQGTVQSLGPGGLIHMASSAHTASSLTNALSQVTQQASVSNLAHMFTSICVTTSFLGVSLCLSDFLADGLKVQHEPSWRGLIIILTFLPPLASVIFYPGLFIKGLMFAGVFCVLLLMLLPATMVLSGRYYKKMASGYQVWGGMPVALLGFVVSLVLLVVGILSI